MKTLLVFLCSIWMLAANAQGNVQEALIETNERDPAAVSPRPNSATHRGYPGGADEDDLQVQAHLPEATMRTDARSLQKDVYKTLFNQELKDDNRDAVEE